MPNVKKIWRYVITASLLAFIGGVAVGQLLTALKVPWATAAIVAGAAYANGVATRTCRSPACAAFASVAGVAPRELRHCDAFYGAQQHIPACAAGPAERP